MNNSIGRKGLVISVILLFIGVAVAPSINFNVVKASNDNDLVEVTTQACGLDSIRNHTVKLTQEQYQNLQQSLAEFKERVYQTTSREEVNEVFNEFIVELHSYGLLGRLSIKQAQYLVTGLFSQYSIHGEAKGNTYFLGPLARIPAKIASFRTGGLITIFACLLGVLVIPPSLFFATYINQKQILSNIFYGYHYYDITDHEGHGWELPASGSVWITSPDGNKSWNGTFYGAIFTILQYLSIGFEYLFLPGVIGFTGLRVYSNSTNVYFGSARKVAIRSDY